MGIQTQPNYSRGYCILKARNRSAFYLGILLLAFAASSCYSIKLISDYDEVTDKSLTAIQQETDAFIDVLIKESGTSEASFDKHKDFYDGIDAQLRHLEFRGSKKKRMASVPRLRLRSYHSRPWVWRSFSQ